MSYTPSTVAPPKRLLKILLFSDDQPGHMNAVIGMGQALLARGHRILFLLNETKAGQLAKYGFREILLHNSNQDKNNFKTVAQILVLSSQKSENSVNNSDKTFIENVCETLFGYNSQIEKAIRLEQPDLIVFDHFLVPPAFPKSGIPYVCVHSASPLSLFKSEKVPPIGAGLPVNSDPSTWEEVREARRKKFHERFLVQDKLNDLCGYKPSEEDRAIRIDRKSKYLTIYGYPEELDYTDIAPIPQKCTRLDAFCRVDVPTGEVLHLPIEFLPKAGEKLIYVSLGSMGSVNVDLMKRITSVLAKTAHKYIVSKGLRADEYDLPDNCWGEAYLPQTRVLPLVDLVITHGGNNTTVESLTFGKPMIVLPLFADQHDNAQRVEEKAFGIRLDTHNFTDEQLIGAIERLLSDETVKRRALKASNRIQSSHSKELVCLQIEQFVDNFVKSNK